MTGLAIERTDGPFGAVVRGLDLREAPDGALAEQLREAWLEHQVLVFPDQELDLEQLEAVAEAFGPIGEDPFFRPIPGQPHVVALTREADETTPLFADVWHSDWSFLPTPPAGTLLYGVDIPPVGGDTLYADQHGAYESLPPDLRERIEGLVGIHSAQRGYAKQGLYGDRDEGRSMAIVASDDALATQPHPLVRTHPETGRKALYVSLAYTIGIEGLDDDAANALVFELIAHAARPEHVHRHRWAPGTVALWDNRCLLHCATGGYEGHRRELHRLTIAERPTT
ncbi:TauD/TfdA family dioxygenase [Aquihabitans sp. G128]|uniref:TauD/TfdA dioxygenase family protein n=1 Tax=Aquihabitans sp. G128 TaxID=2849779 RepID=UPI001C22ACE7|nr:TauD/TfdA family dioxygenase [Aquihabitans sp. G128]QXC62362.1 TauD/TfdA family dioxygenase [Aquihabitans sp. G128]